MDKDITEKSSAIFLLQKRCRGQKRKKKVKKPRFWVRDIFCQREQYGELTQLVQELKTGDREFNFRCVYILIILAVYLSCTRILVSCRLVAVE